MPNLTRILDQDENFAAAAWREVLVVIWKHDTTLPGVEASHRSVQKLAAQNPDGIAMLTIVEAGAPMPSPEARDALAKTLADNGDRIKVSAVVYEGAGFRAAAVRSVVTGLSLVARQPFPHKVFATVNAAAAWMASMLPKGAVSSRELSDVVSELRSEAERQMAS